MEFEPQKQRREVTQVPEFAEPPVRQPLVLLRDTERSLRYRALDAFTPILPEKLAESLGEASLIADDSLEQLAEIDLEQISDAELRPFRIRVGLVMVGFGALMMVFLLLYLNTLHPELSPTEQMQHYWYQYIWFVCIGVTGFFMLGREAMRPDSFFEEEDDL